MIEKCPECKEKIEVLSKQPTQQIPSWVITSTFDMTSGEHPNTGNIYKCSNPKCWVTKIHESWE